MAGRILEEDVRAVREAARIDQVVSAYTTLRPSGAGSYMGLCPFHNERTPSFSVNANMGLYYCFGCHAKGDTISFKQDKEGMSFVEAIESLASQFGIRLRYEEMTPGQRQRLSQRTHLKDIHAAAATFYANQLAQSSRARAYLHERGLTEETIRTFNLGYAPDAWNDLANHLIQAGFSASDIEEAGLCTSGKYGLTDRFRARIMFPILDATAKDVVAFGGRLIPGDLEHISQAKREAPDYREPPKYLNSPSTPIYDKSTILYGLAQSRGGIVRANQVLVVEGYLDVIGLAQVGVNYAVAPCGTAMTPEHMALLATFNVEVTLCLDADLAGFRATDKARQLAEDAEVLDLSIITLPADTDPFDIAIAQGAQGVADILAHAKSALAFQLEYVLSNQLLHTFEQQTRAYQLVLPLLGKLDDSELRFKYINSVVAPATGVRAEKIEADLNESYPIAQQKRVNRQRKLRGQGETTQDPLAHLSPELRIQRIVLQGMIQHPDWIPEHAADVDAALFSDEASREVLTSYIAHDYSFEALVQAQGDGEMRERLYRLALSPDTVREPKDLFNAVLDLKKQLVRREQTRLQALLDTTTDAAKEAVLLEHINALGAAWQELDGQYR